MTDKEFKRLSRAQLIEIIYQLQLQVDEITKENQTLKVALADKRTRIKNAGNLAEAALEINNCFRDAQNAADQYLRDLKALCAETEAERKKILDQAHAEAAAILAEAKKTQTDYDSLMNSILKEYKQNQSNDG